MRSRFTMIVLAPTIGVSVLLMLVGAGAAWYAHRMNRDVSDSVTEKVAGVIAAQQLLDELRDLRRELDGFADRGDADHLDAIAAFTPKISRLLEAADETATTPQSRQLCDQAGGRYAQFLAGFDQLVRQPGDPESAAERARELVHLLDSEVLVSAAALTDYRESEATASSQRNQAIASRIGVGILLLGICGAVGGLLAGYGIARAINRSVMQLSMPVRDMAGELDQVVGPITVWSDGDLTGLEEAMRTLSAKTADVVRSLQESQQQTLRAEQLAAVGQLAAGLAHELRNPLMSLKLLVQTARERSDSGGLHERDLAVMEEEIGRQEKMLQTFLDFARPPQPKMTALDVPVLIGKTVQVVQPRAAQQNVQITADCDQLPAIQGDESQLRQVLLNLLLNALDALPQGGNVWIRAERLDCPEAVAKNGEALRGTLMIRVSDDGPGLPPAEERRIFDPFVSTKTTGIGLGLSISQRIVQTHGGEITARNRGAGGAEFTVRLPVRGEKSPPPPAAATHDQAQNHQPSAST